MTNIYQELAIFSVGTVLCLGAVIDALPVEAVTLETERDTFLNTNPIVSTETFDSFGVSVFPGTSVTIDSITYTDPNAPEWRIDTVNATAPFSLFSNEVGANILTFGDNQFVNQLGFFLIPFGSDPVSGNLQFQFIVEEITGVTTSFASVPQAGFNNFLGFSSNAGIRRLVVSPQRSSGGVLTNYSFDNVSRSEIQSVPEPTPVSGLLLVFLFGASSFLKRKLLSPPKSKCTDLGGQEASCDRS